MLQAKDIEGHVENQDIDFLLQYVNSAGRDHSSVSVNNENSKNVVLNAVTNNANKESSTSLKKKEKVNVNSILTKKKNSNNANPQYEEKEDKASNNIPSSASSSSSCSDESTNKPNNDAQKTQRQISSPTNSSSIDENCSSKQDSFEREINMDSGIEHLARAKTFLPSGDALSDDEQMHFAVSDSEMPDRDTGFIVAKSKKYMRRKGTRKNEQLSSLQRSSYPSAASSSSTTPSLASSTAFATNSRGYESEREYSEEYRRYQDIMRRKSVSSMPHSEQNSADNSDGEFSSHSMPVRGGSIYRPQFSRTTPSSMSTTPKASYADIAKSPNVKKLTNSLSVNLVNNEPLLEKISSNETEEFPKLNQTTTIETSVSGNDEQVLKDELIEEQTDLNNFAKPLADSNNSGNMPADSCCRGSSNVSNSCASPTFTNTHSLQSVSENYVTTTSAKLADHKAFVTCSNDFKTIPAVIMCDSQTAEHIGAHQPFTFGFFEDISENEQLVKTTPLKNSAILKEINNEKVREQIALLRY